MASILDGLTGAEIEVLHLLAAGLSNSEIALQRNCSAGSVKFHVGNILFKTHASSRMVAAVRYIREVEAIAPPTIVTRIVRQPVECPGCALRTLIARARDAGFRVLTADERGVRVATSWAPTGVLLHDEQDLTDLCTELAEAA